MKRETFTQERDTTRRKMDVYIEIPGVTLFGVFTRVDNPRGIVVFAHGAGSSRLSPRNTQVADVLNDRRFSTLLFDLLTEREDQVYENRFDIDLISERLAETTHWLIDQKESKGLSLGYFGASTGAAAALKASIEFPEKVKAVVSRGGRPDLVLSDLGKVKAPTLLLVGGHDDMVIGLNEKAYRALGGVKDMKIIPGATHLFEEPGTLEMVSEEAAMWFEKYLQ